MSDSTAPRFSVVVPALNEAELLPVTLASLAAQQLEPDVRVEIIVVDNGSTDQTASVARDAGVRVVVEPRAGVCAARQAGTDAARGEIVVSTDADTTHPPDWLARIDARFRAEPDAVAVAGPCRYVDPPWWAAIVPPLWFAALDRRYRRTGRIDYLTATNVAFRRAGFPGYDTTLTQGGDEMDLLRRLRRTGRVEWDAGNVVLTSSRRMDQGLAHTVIVSFGFYYALSDLLNRLTGRRVIGVAPQIRNQHRPSVQRRRRRWRLAALSMGAMIMIGCSAPAPPVGWPAMTETGITGSSFLLAATPLYGHVAPMLVIGRALRSRGHRVQVLTGAAYAAVTAAHGLDFRALPAEAEPVGVGQRRVSRLRVVAGREAIIDTFLRPLPAQHTALAAALADDDHDALVSDAAFLGAVPMLVDLGRRLPTVGISLTPLSMVSSDCAPFGSGLHPGRSAIARRRNELITWLLDHGPLRPLHRTGDAVLSELGVRSGTFNYFDHVAAFDRAYHLAAPAIEYPRRDLPRSIEIVGPLRAEAPAADEPPAWWAGLDHDHRPLVHVTQGTMDNSDLGKLLVPTILALADEPVRVVASTGGRHVDDLSTLLGRPLPANVELTEFVGYERLLPRCAVMITNGGYGGVQQALRHGVPVIVAGDSEEKPEVAARVSWAGVGRDLGTGRPSPRRIRAAVRSVLADPDVRQRAAGVAAQLARLGDPLPRIVAGVEQLVSASPAEPRRRHATQ